MFKNIFMFAFTRKFTATQEHLEMVLSDHLFTPCASTELSHFGFVPALGKYGKALTHEASGNILIKARKEEKILPAPVIKDAVDERVDQLETEQDRNAHKKEKEQIKEDVIFDLLPRAFSRYTNTEIYINAELNLVVINASSRGKAEDILSLLRKALGTLPVTSFTPDVAPDETMTDWLYPNIDKGFKFPGVFSLGCEAWLSAIGDNAPAAHVKNENLQGAEVRSHLDAEKLATKIAIEYDDTMSFILHDDLSIKRIKFSDDITGQNDGIDVDDHLARLDADFTLMTGETNRMIVDLLGEFGLNTSEYLDQ